MVALSKRRVYATAFSSVGTKIEYTTRAVRGDAAFVFADVGGNVPGPPNTAARPPASAVQLRAFETINRGDLLRSALARYVRELGRRCGDRKSDAQFQAREWRQPRSAPRFPIQRTDGCGLRLETE